MNFEHIAMTQVELYNAGLDMRILVELWMSIASSYINGNHPRVELITNIFTAYFKLEPESSSDLWAYLEDTSNPNNPYNVDPTSVAPSTCICYVSATYCGSYTSCMPMQTNKSVQIFAR